MTKQEAKQWLSVEANQTHPQYKNIDAEVDLITVLESKKCNHFTPPEMNKLLKNGGMNYYGMTVKAMQGWIKETGVTVSNYDPANEEFIAKAIECRKWGYLELKRKGILELITSIIGETEMYDEQWRCANDIKQDHQINISLEYIAELIKKEVPNVVSEMQP
jgi:hypothetical protein